MTPYLLYDHRFYPTDTPLVEGASRGLRYGDGLFETMKVREGVLQHAALHFERLWKGMETLRIGNPYTVTALEEEALSLCARNGHTRLGRVRLNVFRGADEVPHCMIETFPLERASASPDDPGLDIGVFPDGRKSMDMYANLKSNNYLLYLMGAAWSREQGLGECLILNARERVADASTSNVFAVINGEICTPPLSEGGVAGVTRRFLMERFPIREAPLGVEDLLGADELFLTNAIQGIRWVRRLKDKTYDHLYSADMVRKLNHL